jgi:hypothetical protein
MITATEIGDGDDDHGDGDRRTRNARS